MQRSAIRFYLRHCTWTSATLMCAVSLVATAHTALAGFRTWTSHGPPAGNILALAIDPHSPSTLYAGTRDTSSEGGDVLKSTDGGATWIAAGAGLNHASVIAFAVDPDTPSTLYAGTRAIDTVSGGFAGGVFKSTDGGATWITASGGLPNYPVAALAVDSRTPTTLYTETGSGVLKSTDGGVTWAAANSGLPANAYVQALAIDPGTPSTLFAGSGAGLRSLPTRDNRSNPEEVQA